MKWTDHYLEMETLRVFIVADTISEIPIPLKDTTWTNVTMGTVEGVTVNGRAIAFESVTELAKGDTFEVIFGDGFFTVE